jgi:ribosomal-protein-alanine N-acetyltransferase
MIVLETERVLLRPFRSADLEDLAGICSNARVMKYLGLRGEPMSREDTETALRSIIAHWERHGFGRWAAVDNRDGKLIGYCGLRSFAKNAELVYLLDHPYWGRGLATEMALSCLAFGFGARSFDHIVAMAKPDNLASRHVLEKVGFRYQQTVKFSRIMAQMNLVHPASSEYEDIDVAQYRISRAVYQHRTGQIL